MGKDMKIKHVSSPPYKVCGNFFYKKALHGGTNFLGQIYEVICRICRIMQKICGIHFFVLDQKNPFWANLVKKNQNCQFKLKFGTKTNLNMRNSMMFTLSVFDHKYLTWANLVQKFKTVQSEICYKDSFEYAKFNGGVCFISFRLKIATLFGELRQKNRNCQFKLKIGTQTNSNMKNSIVVLIFFCFRPEVYFFWNFVPKIEIVC